MFCDISRSLSQAPESENVQNLVSEYRKLVMAVVGRYKTPFILPGDGPLILICFDSPKAAAEAAAKIQKGLEIWRSYSDDRALFVPTIGLHTGEFVVRDDELMQSHDCNLGKRIETEADIGQITLSSTTSELLEDDSTITFLRTANVKNIPEPQQIFSLDWSLTLSPDIDYAVLGMDRRSEEEIEMLENAEDEQFMGIIVMDIAGSSKKFWNLGDREGNILVDTYQKQVLPVLKKFKADHIEPGEGDQIVACFDSGKIVETVQAAIEIQQSLFRYNSHKTTRGALKIEISTGVHIGGVVIRDERVVPTPDFFVCKGIQDSADASEILLSDQIAAMVCREPSFSLKDVGCIEIKGFPNPVTVHEIEWFRSARKDSSPGLPGRPGLR